MIYEAPPPSFLTVRVDVTDKLPTLLGLCAGYELGKWRSEQFARYLKQHLIQFVYPVEEWANVTSATADEMLRKAAITIYTTDKHQNRGEIGELILFAIMRSHYKSLPLISKFYFKDSSNDTVKGFDGVHIVEGIGGYELWLGEAKFYTKATDAIRDAIQSISEHLEADYLRKEFIWIGNKMPSKSDGLDGVRHLLDENTSLDDVFPVLHIPVLITYESPVISNYSRVTEEYKKAISDEMNKLLSYFNSKCKITNISIHLIIVPLYSKDKLQEDFDEKLKGAQL